MLNHYKKSIQLHTNKYNLIQVNTKISVKIIKMQVFFILIHINLYSFVLTFY